MKMDKKKKLSSLKMPSKRSDELDLGGDDAGEYPEGSPEEENAESPDEEKMEMDHGEGDEGDAHGDDHLAAVPDEDLMAEVKKRGLLGKLDEEEQSEGEHDMSFMHK